MDLNQVTLPVRNIQEVVSFYLQLGVTQIVDTPTLLVTLGLFRCVEISFI